jgi:prophage antirepressor-like protein
MRQRKRCKIQLLQQEVWRALRAEPRGRLVSAAITLITSQFEGHELTTYVFRGRICMIAAHVGRALSYADDGKRLVDRIRDDWADEFIEGNDFDVLTGAELREFKAIIGDTPDSGVSSTARLMVLYESGFDLACVRTDKPAGKRLRRLLVDEAIPKLRRGETIGPAGGTPVLDVESQIRILALRHRESLSLYTVVPGLYSDDFLRHKVEHGAALVMGQKPVVEIPLLDVTGYLQSRGLTAAERKSNGSTFGKRVKALYVAKHGEPPGKLARDVNGGSREVFSYTEQDRQVFDQAFEEMAIARPTQVAAVAEPDQAEAAHVRGSLPDRAPGTIRLQPKSQVDVSVARPN